SQQVASGDFLRESNAPAAKDAALVVELDTRRELVQLAFVMLRFVRARPRGAKGILQVLQTALTSLVADTAIHRMVKHQELHDLAPCALDLERRALHLHVGG